MGIPAGSHILVTGATGFLGGRAVECLRQRYVVTATGRDETKASAFWSRGIRFVPCDLNDRNAAIALCRGQDYVFHCAALTAPWEHYQDYYQSNVQAVAHLIEGCEKGGVTRFVHVSTASIYFDFQDRVGVKESFLPSAFANDYAATKHLSEKLLLDACDRGFDALILRPGPFFGPGDRAFLPRLLGWNEDRFIPLMRGGSPLLDPTYVDNVIDALVLAAGAPGRYRGRAYNISNGQPIAWKALFDMLFASTEIQSHCMPLPYPIMDLSARLMEWRGRRWDFKQPWMTRFDVGQLGRSLTLNIERAQKEIGYQPRVLLEDGVARFAHWWCTNVARPGMVLPSAERVRLPEAAIVCDEDYIEPYEEPGEICGA